MCCLQSNDFFLLNDRLIYEIDAFWVKVQPKISLKNKLIQNTHLQVFEPNVFFFRLKLRKILKN